ncbi:type II toxin-antitoxin system RelE/ParE family toxin [Candidatus Azambacteria bacterium]|nr:type II toxin-antitoxin system RelE/ParE family toxin [Candidatus Azambacteria bacterium]
MDQLLKALQKLTEKERKQVDDILKRIEAGQFAGLDVKKLKGYEYIFRVRRGRLRIIYKKEGEKIALLMIDRRNDNTYKNMGKMVG